MSRQWPWLPLKEACQIKPSKKEARERFDKSDMVSFVPMNDLGVRQKYLVPTQEKHFRTVSSSYTYFSEGDVLLAKITPCFENGKLGIARDLTNGAGFGSSEFFVLRPKECLKAEYLFYYLSQDSFLDLGRSVMSGAVGHKRVPKEFIESHLLPLPTVSEQERIVAILDEAFASIDIAIANTEKNLADAWQLFERYRDSIFEDGQNAWEQVKFGDLYHISSSKRVHKKDWRSSGVPFYRAREIVKLAENGFVENELFISEELFEEYGEKTGVPSAGDLMVTAVGTLGTCYVVQSSDRFYFKDASVLWFRPKQKINGDFIKHAFRSSLIKRQTTDSQGATVGTLTISRASSISISVPDLQRQNSIAIQLADFESEVIALRSLYQNKLDALKELKQSLAQKAFAGELTAAEMETEAKEATA